MNNCICLICLKPNVIWIEFLNKFTHYDVFIIIDDNSVDYASLYNEYVNIHFIQIINKDCETCGFMNINFTIKNITGWEKALYYFSNINLNYENVWFIEDDVFFNSEDTLMNIDKQYENSDLLTNKYIDKDTQILRGEKWHWKKIKINFDPPYYRSMVCACRMSKQMLREIKNYADINKTLFFLEALFPTICKKYNFAYDTPKELSNIFFRKIYKETDVNSNNLYHPIKNMHQHETYRNKLKD